MGPEEGEGIQGLSASRKGKTRQMEESLWRGNMWENKREVRRNQWLET